MEFPSLGEQCEWDHCNKLQFLPLKCACQHLYCPAHFMLHAEHCEANRKERKDHLEPSIYYKCHLEGCKDTSILRLPCPKCEKHYCIQHRFHESCPEIDPEELAREKKRWEEPRAQYNKVRKLIDEEVTRKLRECQKSSSKSITAMKVQLMKFKSKAKGENSIPSSNRIYFGVLKPENDTPKQLVSHDESEEVDLTNKYDFNAAVPVFVAIDWTLGRVVDSIARTLNLRNQNNVFTAPKLRVFRGADGAAVYINKMDEKMENIIRNEVLVNGDVIIVDYVTLPEDKSEENCAYFVVR